MIIKDVTLTSDATKVVMSARCKIRKIGWDTVYFSLLSGQRDYVYEDASPFAAALLIPSMRQGEDLIIHGSISKQLLEGMKAVMAVVLTWNIGLSPIEIKADTVVEDTHKPSKTGSFFSGGVDSFYTYLKHKNDPVDQGRPDNLILVNGFDIDLRSKELWRLTRANIEALAAEEQMDLIVAETNLQKLLEPILLWDFAHGACLGALGLFLRTGLARVYIPSTFTTEEQLPWGSHLELDHHWGTERVGFIHDGVEATRLNKVLWQVAKSPTALKYLRVCYMNTTGTYNCGVCSKCIRTMISLYVAGVLAETKTFPSELDIERIARTPSAINEGEQIFLGELQNIEALRERDLSPELQKAIVASMELTMEIRNGSTNKRRQRINQLMARVMYTDHVYLRGYTYVVLSRLFGRKFI